MTKPKRNLYFAYGSNLWLRQMAKRCPDSPYAGIARLDGWKFIINERGPATIVRAPNDHVYGLVYELAEIDEETLDINEGVPTYYEKRYLKMTVWYASGEDNDAGVRPDVNINAPGEEAGALTYVDPRTKEGKPREEYVFRMGMGIDDGLSKGIPKAYFDEYLRPWIPLKTKEELEAYAKPRVITNADASS